MDRIAVIERYCKIQDIKTQERCWDIIHSYVFEFDKPSTWKQIYNRINRYDKISKLLKK